MRINVTRFDPKGSFGFSMLKMTPFAIYFSIKLGFVGFGIAVFLGGKDEKENIQNRKGA